MADGFRRGFKTEVASLVAELRADYGARPLDPIDPAELAAWLGIPVVGVSDIGDTNARRMRGVGLDETFHAATIPFRTGVAIVHNDWSPVTRQRSDIAHELGHVCLEHDFYQVNVHDLDNRSRLCEREADWFGFSLLIPDEAALSLARARLPIPECARLMGTSEAAMQYRLNASGAVRRAANERARRR